MASSFVWFGVLLILLGIIGYNIPLSVTLAEGATVNLTIPKVVAFCDSGLGQFAQISPQVVMVCSEYNNLLYGIYGAVPLGIILIIVGVIKPESSKKNESEYICGYCKFVAQSERELHNHSLECEAYKKKSKLRNVKCKCGHEFATLMEIPRCGKCGAYTEEKK